MTVLAPGYHPVLCLVTERAFQGLMLGLARREEVEGLLVTRGAVL